MPLVEKRCCVGNVMECQMIKYVSTTDVYELRAVLSDFT